MRLIESICGEGQPVQRSFRIAEETAPVPAFVTAELILVNTTLSKPKLLDNITFLANMSLVSSECETPGRGGVLEQARKFSHEWGLKIEAASTGEFSFKTALFFERIKNLSVQNSYEKPI
jgi:hypothetical protein